MGVSVLTGLAFSSRPCVPLCCPWDMPVWTWCQVSGWVKARGGGGQGRTLLTHVDKNGGVVPLQEVSMQRCRQGFQQCPLMCLVQVKGQGPALQYIRFDLNHHKQFTVLKGLLLGITHQLPPP